MDSALLLVRLVVGLLFAAHGAQKILGWFGGYGLAGTGGYLEGLGFRPGRFWAAVGGISELGGGLLFALGLVSPLAAASVIGTMLVAARTDHKGKGLWIFNGGWEYGLVLTAVSAAVAISGPGEWSLDHALGWELAGNEWGAAAFVAGAITALLTLAARKPASLVAVEPGQGQAA